MSIKPKKIETCWDFEECHEGTFWVIIHLNKNIKMFDGAGVFKFTDFGWIDKDVCSRDKDGRLIMPSFEPMCHSLGLISDFVYIETIEKEHVCRIYPDGKEKRICKTIRREKELTLMFQYSCLFEDWETHHSKEFSRQSYVFWGEILTTLDNLCITNKMVTEVAQEFDKFKIEYQEKLRLFEAC